MKNLLAALMLLGLAMPAFAKEPKNDASTASSITLIYGAALLRSRRKQ